MLKAAAHAEIPAGRPGTAAGVTSAQPSTTAGTPQWREDFPACRPFRRVRVIRRQDARRDPTAFNALISRREQQARDTPPYTATVVLVALLGLLLLGVAISFSLMMIGVFAGIVVLALKYGGGGRFRPSMEGAPADSENLHEAGPTQAEARGRPRGRRFYR